MIMTSILPPAMLAHASDAALIIISGSAVFYCAMLSRRLKKLSNLKTGVGASILTLTQAIEQTHQAAQETQSSTLQTTLTLRHLLEKSESEAPKIEALVTDLVRGQKLAKAHVDKFETDLDAILAPALKEARHTAKVLVALLAECKRQSAQIKDSLTPKSASAAVPNKPSASIPSPKPAKLVSIK